MATEKRFTICEEQEFTDGWSMGITDHQTKEPFDVSDYMFHSSKKTATKEELEDLCLVINELNDENEQLKHQNNQLRLVIGEINEKCTVYIEMIEKGDVE